MECDGFSWEDTESPYIGSQKKKGLSPAGNYIPSVDGVEVHRPPILGKEKKLDDVPGVVMERMILASPPLPLKAAKKPHRRARRSSPSAAIVSVEENSLDRALTLSRGCWPRFWTVTRSNSRQLGPGSIARHRNRDEDEQRKDISSREEAPSLFDHREKGHMGEEGHIHCQSQNGRRSCVPLLSEGRRRGGSRRKASRRESGIPKAPLRTEKGAYEICHQADGRPRVQGESSPDPAGDQGGGGGVNCATGSLSRIDDPSSRTYRSSGI